MVIRNVGIAKETRDDERRVALTPAVVPALVKAGLSVLVESGAGVEAGFADDAYRDRGAEVVSDRDEVFDRADLIAQVRTLGANAVAGRSDLERFRPGQVVVGLASPLDSPEANREMARRGVTLFALELVPRSTRAQAMDVLSSQATVAGYKAVLVAAGLPKLFPMMTTAAGTLTPARVLVIGAGVAGLQAIATARRLGAVVEAYDVRPAAGEDVESLGARFVELPLRPGDAEDASGYAKALGEAFYRRQQGLLAQTVAKDDIVICTALLRGLPSPLLVTADAVDAMAAGSVIVDLAAERGGNCAVTVPDQTVVTDGGVTVLGPTNLAATVPLHASQMFAKNVSAFILHLVHAGELIVDPADPIATQTLVCRDGQVVNPRLHAVPDEGRAA